MKQAVILGAGIIGLSTAFRLKEAGFSVKVVAQSFSPDTTSDKAGAIWFPYNVFPPARASAWCKHSYKVYEKQVGITEAGVSMVHFKVGVKAEEFVENGLPWWTEGFPSEDAYRRLPDAGTADAACFFELYVPFIEPVPYMAYLKQALEDAGVVFEQALVEDLDAFCKQNEGALVVNCTGLGSKSLLSDGEMYAIRGQMIALSPIEGLRHLKVDQGPTLPTYIFPRKNAIMLGGSAIRHSEDMQIDEGMNDDIYRRCVALEPRLATAERLYSYVGLRPGRKSIRLERQGNLIHNYGHGGGGYTAAWGCAEEAARLALE